MQLRVQEGDAAVVAEARRARRVDTPAPRPGALPLANREELLERPPVDEDRLRADRHGTGGAVGEAMPVSWLDALRLEGDRRVAASDAEARVLDGQDDTGGGMADERRVRLVRAESLGEEGGCAFRARLAAELHDRNEDRRGEGGERRQTHRGCAAQGGNALGFRRGITGPQFRKVRHVV